MTNLACFPIQSMGSELVFFMNNADGVTSTKIPMRTRAQNSISEHSLPHCEN